MKQYAIIVAGGHGTRMGTSIPKQFLSLAGRPILMHTLKAFVKAIPSIHLILVLPPDQQAYWQQLCEEHHFTLPHEIADGGDTRFASVKNGLQHIPLLRQVQEPPSTLVGIHDGVRPLVSTEVIQRCFAEAATAEAVIPVVPVVETLRLVNVSVNVPVPREAYRLVQTPQTFSLSLLRKAYEQPYREEFTDDATVVEALGHPITMISGNRENIKITTPSDLIIAEALIKHVS